MRKTKFLPPYTKAGKTTFPHTLNKSGVYVIQEDAKIVYVGYSGKNLYRTMYRHFQVWNHRGQDVVTYVNSLHRKKYTVRVVLCTVKQADALEKGLIMKHRPRDNENKYSLFKSDLYHAATIEKYEEIPVSELIIPDF